MKIQMLLNSSRTMLFENDFEGFEYSARGTVFLCFYEGQLYAITAAHVIKGFQADAVRVMIHPEDRDFLPHNAQVTLVSADLDDPDYSDLAVFSIQQDMFEHDRFRDWPPFRLSDQLVNATPPQDGRLIFRGLPTDQSGIDFDTYRIRLQPVILEGERVGAAPRAHCHKVKLHDVSVCSTLDGFSGSPVFWISDHEAPKEYYFVGVLIKGTHSSKTAYYVDGGWFTIGPHGPLNPDQARARALEILACAKKGIDPRDADARREAEPSMADLGRRFLEEYVPVHCKPSTREEYLRSVKLFVDPVIGELRVPEVQRKDIAALHHGLRDKPYQANRTLGVLSKMFSLAEVWGWRPDGSNPCRHVKRYKEHKRERFLSPEETERLGQVLREAEEEMPSAVAAFRLLLLTGCRMSEIRDLRWDYVKDDCIELPDAKTGGRVVPLGPEARAVLSAIPRDEDNPWVIAGRLPGSHLTDLQRPWRRIRKQAGLEGVRIHDLRHSFASRALALGESLTMIGKLLGHTQVQTTARYAHLHSDRSSPYHTEHRWKPLG